MIIKTPDGYRGERWKHRITMLQNIGSVTSTTGIDNEVERIWSSLLLHDVVMQLKLYVDYREEGRWKTQSVYATQPVTVDLDRQHLDSLDKVAIDEFCNISLVMWKEADEDSTFMLRATLYDENEIVFAFEHQIKKLPAKLTTPYGTILLKKNPQGCAMTVGKHWYATINPPLYTSLTLLGRLSVSKHSNDYTTLRSWLRYYFKESSIAELTFLDQDKRRGMDIIRQIVASYNRQAVADKNEIALRSQEFINDRLASLSEELGSVDSNIVDIKRQGSMTSLRDAALSVRNSDKLSTQLTDATTQVMLIDELNTLMDKPSNQYDIIPSTIGLSDKTATGLINKYNTMVQSRNRLLRSASEEAVQVKQLTASIEEMRSAITGALQQARQSAVIQQKGVSSQYNTFRGRVSSLPTAERALMDVGRDQSIKSKLYMILLKRREETSIALSSEANNGKLIDEPTCEGQVRPNLLLAYGIGLFFGLAIPYAVFVLLGFLRYKLEDHEELTQLTNLPIIADVPTANESDKDKSGIVVRYGMNRPIDEVYRLMRTNLRFMMRSNDGVILFTSTTSGEGKTFNAANLAMSYALLGKRVVLCGLDLRKPALGRLFGLHDTSRGMTLLLAKAMVTNADVCDQIQPSGLDKKLDLLLAGPEAPNSAELLARDSFRQVLDILKKTYDYVILDSAPVGLVTDTFQICDQADVTVYVCRANYTPKYHISQLNTMAEEGKLKNPCIVLNGCESVS